MNGFGMITRLFTLLALSLVLFLPTREAAAITTPEQVKEFVQAIYIEGVPYDQASQLDPDIALPVLKQVLANPREEDSWANAAVTIGMIGNDQGVDLLVQFITRREAKQKLSRAQTVAKTSAVMALGYIVNKTGNRKALDFLKTGADPQAWRKRNLAWTGVFHRTVAERDNQLTVMAVLGLGVSGNPEAAQTLRSLKEPPITPKLRALRNALPDINTVTDEALKANSEISSEGMNNYYLKNKPKNSPDEGRREVTPRREINVLKAPVTGEVIQQPRTGEVLKQPQLGEVLAPPKAGKVLRQPQKGEVIKQK